MTPRAAAETFINGNRTDCYRYCTDASKACRVAFEIHETYGNRALLDFLRSLPRHKEGS